ncbi:cyclodeaminase/cyclohydrolase family protein [Bacillus sp. FJAT-50079]|uniref:cyclodeaminase/cyclohydrolase family protein n=1 Tax=Bacillus sp. FJAT-50079 TaxID=2833577 RepID=UPI001BC93C4A|nr:cyclodeaminase/cyclohydrolase family protein [Bacillus sp. FJAT-50079]MBS4209998.1 cyclodeaminase/cyclohydrolase family protein [Bacillus sp. FJAT-50079]
MTSVTWDHSIRTLIQQAASSQPTPGGGSISALTATLGATMTSMVGSLSKGEKFEEICKQSSSLVEKMKDIITSCEELFFADINAFEKYMNALRLPSSTDVEKENREQSLQIAIVQAIEVPIKLMKVCQEGLQNTYRIVELANKNVISDLGIGAILFEAAAHSAFLTVEMNLSTLKEIDLKQRYTKQTSILIKEIEELKESTLKMVHHRIILF